LSIDFDKIFSAVWSALYRLIRIPFRFINNLSPTIKIILTIILIIIILLIAILVYKYRNEWRTVRRI